MNKIELILNVAQLVLQVVKDMRKLSDSVQKVCDTVMEGLSEKEQPKAIEQKLPCDGSFCFYALGNS